MCACAHTHTQLKSCVLIESWKKFGQGLRTDKTDLSITRSLLVTTSAKAKSTEGGHIWEKYCLCILISSGSNTGALFPEWTLCSLSLEFSPGVMLHDGFLSLNHGQAILSNQLQKKVMFCHFSYWPILSAKNVVHNGRNLHTWQWGNVKMLLL